MKNWKVSALTALILSVGLSGFAQVAKTNSTQGTVFSTGPNHISRTFTYVGGDFAGCVGLTEVEIAITLTMGSDASGSCASGIGGYSVQEDLNLRLVSPSGTSIDLVQDKWGYWTGTNPQPNTLSSFATMNPTTVLFDDDGAVTIAGDYSTNPVARPHNALSGFDGENPVGVWTLHISDGNGQFSAVDYICFSMATLTVTCGVVANPEIDIEGNTISIPDGDVTPALGDDTDFGSVSIGASPSNTFTIQNEGTSSLTLSGGPTYVALSGSSLFAITSQPSGTIAAAGSSTFNIQFNAACPNTAGTYTATVSISSDDADESPYTFDIEAAITGVDTDSDGVLDLCDTDDDNDGILDGSDPDDTDFNICGDSDADGCDDCSVTNDGFGALSDSDPSNDGPDADCDGICDATDATDDSQTYRGNMLSFDGTDDYVSLGNVAELNFDKSDDFTVEAWINSASTSTAMQIISKYEGDLFNATGWGFQISSSSLAFYMAGGSLFDFMLSVPTGTPNVKDGLWHHVAVSYDGSNNVTGCTFYIDGIAYAGIDGGGTVASVVGTVSNSESASIGAYNGTISGVGEYWDGKMDEVRVWNDQRTQTEVRENRHLSLSGVCDGNLDGYWKFNEVAGITSFDLSGNGNDGTLMGGVSLECSEASVGRGVATTHSMTATATNYMSLSLWPNHAMNINFATTTPGGEVVVSYIDELPFGGAPTGALTDFSNSHWIVDNYGPTNAGLDGTMHYDYPDGGIPTGSLANYNMHKRGSNEIAAWIQNNTFANAASNVPGNNYIEFASVSSFSMFMPSSGVSGLYLEECCSHVPGSAGPCTVACTVPVIFNDAPVVACDNMMINGNTYFTTQLVRDTLSGAAANGCDSIVNTPLTINYTVIFNDAPVVSCDSMMVNGNMYYTTQLVRDTISGGAANGCDSIVNTPLTINYTVINNDPPVVSCDSMMVNGNMYYTTQLVRDTISGGAANGCDSIVNTPLTINYTVIFNDAPVVSCDSMMVNGNMYYTTQLVRDTLSGAATNGCDSIVNTPLTINYTVIFNDAPVVSCDSMMVNGNMYYTTQLVRDTLSGGAANGCDSIVNTSLTINYTVIFNDAPVVSCDSMMVNGNTYFTTQLVRDTIFGGAANGCDSIVNTPLTINYTSIFNDAPIVACDSMMVNGNMYYTTQLVRDTIFGAAANGCDSIVNTPLTINYTVIFNDAPVVSCDSMMVNGNTYYTTQLVRDTLSGAAANGCDSIVNTPLTINYSPTAPSVVSPLVVCPGSDVILSASGSGTGSLIFYDNIPNLLGTVAMPPASGTFNAGALSTGAYTFGVAESNGVCQSPTVSIIVTVGDIIPPTAVCQNITVYLNGAGTASILASDLDGGSTDNCGTVNFTASQIVYTCANLGTNNTALTVDDGNGNTDICIGVVTVIDTISPTMICPGNQVENFDASCQFTLPDYTSLVTASDNCNPSPTVTQSPAASTVISGNTTLTMTTNDGNGNTSTCTFDIVPNDATPPIAVCQNISAYVDGAGNVTVLASDLDGGSTDNCGTPTFAASQTAFTCADLGTNNVTMTASDGVNTSNCVAVVTVIDTISPAAVCQNINAYLDGAGNVSIVASDLDGGSTDNCGTVAFNASTTAFTCADLGTNNVTLTIDDGNGNTDVCVGVVTVIDTISPVMVCQNINAYLDGAGNVSFVAADLDGGSTDNCGGVVTLSASTTSFTCADLGTNNVSLIGTDASSNVSSCVAVVTVIDTLSPTAICQNINAYLDGAGNVTIIASDLGGGSTDNCGTVTFSASQTAFTCADLGTNNSTLTVDDGNGNTDVCVAVVTIIDTISPTVTCPGNQTENPDAACNFTLPDYTSLGTAADNCGSATITQSPIATTVISGTTTITLTAADGNGNSSTCTFDVVLNDAAPPTAVCQNISIYLDAAGNATIVGADLDGGSTDNCSGITFTASQTTFTCADLGTSPVTMTATDGNSNTDNCTAMVTVLDTITPVMTCPGNQTEIADALCQGILGNYTGLATAVDVCDASPVVTQSPIAGTTFTGTQTVWLYGTDASGNVDSCSITVGVTDVTPPTITCPADQNVDFSATCDYTLLGYTAMATTADNCGTVTVTQSPITGTVITATTSVILYANDGNGNIDSCAFDVIPADNTAPSITCPADQNVSFSGACDYTLLDYTAMAITADNCSAVVTVTQSPASGTVVTGAALITLYGDDGNGNIDSCSFNVIPADTTAPTAVCQDITVYLDASGTVSITAVDIDGGSTDECGTPTLSSSQTAFTCADAGVNVVTLTVTDGGSNTSTCNANVTVLDTITPTIVCIADQNVSLSGTCDYTLLDYTTLMTVTENCTPTVTQFPVAGTVITASTLITMTVTDGSGNTSNCTFNVNPSDTDLPVITCPIDETIILDANCEVLLPDYTLTATISDNCDATPTVVQTPAAGTVYAEEGVVDVMIVVTDTSGNVDSCSLVVTIAIDAASGCNTDIIVSNLLSPNGDGKNDFWIIHDPVDIAGCDVLVYNRWGQQVFSSKNYNNDWDGTFNGEPLPDGSYYYVIQCDGSVKEKGALTILRLKK